MRLKNKTAIITGGGSGFGEGMARRFAEEGAKVLVAISQSFHSLGHGEDVAQLGIQAFGLKKSQLHCGDSREIGVGNQVGNSNAHVSPVICLADD